MAFITLEKLAFVAGDVVSSENSRSPSLFFFQPYIHLRIKLYFKGLLSCRRSLANAHVTSLESMAP